MSPGGGAASGQLANLIVQFVTKGQQELQKSLEDIQTAIGAVVLAVQKMNTQLLDSMEKAKEKTQKTEEQVNKLSDTFGKLGVSIKAALGVGIGTISGLVTAGIAASGMGQVMEMTFRRLALTVAGMFGPEIRKVIDLINQLTNWLQSLTDEQKKTIVQFVALGAAALAFSTGGLAGMVAGAGMLGVTFGNLGPVLGQLANQLLRVVEAMQPIVETVVKALTPAIEGLANAIASLSDETLINIMQWAAAIGTFVTVLTIIPKVVAAIRTVIAAIRALNIAQIIMLALSGPKGWATLAAGAVAAGAALAAYLGIEKSAEEAAKRRADREKGGTASRGERGALQPRLGGFESLNQTFERIAVASMRVSAGLRSPEERTAAATEESARTLGRIANNTGNPPPVFAR